LEYRVEKISIVVIVLVSAMLLVSQLFRFLSYGSILELDSVNLAKAQTDNSTSNSVATLMDRANKLDTMGKYDEAAVYYNKSLAINSTNVDALNGIANDLDNLQRYDEALTYYNKVLAIDPTNVDALNGIANDLDKLQRYDEALTYYNKVLSIDPTNVDALNGRADDLDTLKNRK
jgi:tetratricopeptide (TPR) repeat protein